MCCLEVFENWSWPELTDDSQHVMMLLNKIKYYHLEIRKILMISYQDVGVGEMASEIT
jgi:hypothetical protein